MGTENRESCSQRDSAERKGYVRAHRSFNRIWKERDSAEPDILSKILDKDNLNRAYRRVKANKGAPGVDGMTIEAALPWLKEVNGMANKTAATFIGHSECYGLNRDNIRPKVIKLIELGVTDFYSGGMGSFDWMCAHVVYDLKKDYPQLNNHLVIPYLTFNILEKKYFDSIIYPEGFEKYHFKAAIPARNRYLVDNAKYALCYITHGWGGAAQTFERAKKKGPVIINLGEKDTST